MSPSLTLQRAASDEIARLDAALQHALTNLQHRPESKLVVEPYRPHDDLEAGFECDSSGTPR
jgi:hypothetical protein